MERRIGYEARSADGSALRILVPSDDDFGRDPVARFRSDLTSVPNVFTWLIPRTGQHLPAAIVHDGLIYDPGEPASYSATKVWPDGHSESVDVSRIEADRIFRDAMFDLGVSWVRRWLMWSAVSLATVASGASDVAPSGQTAGRAAVLGERSQADTLRNLYYRVVVFGTLALITAIGLLAFVDIFDWWNVLPWMGAADTGRELLLGGLFAFLIPTGLSFFWWKLWPAGIIVGVSLAVFIYPTLLLLALTAGFAVLDYATRNRTTPVLPATAVHGPAEQLH
ncbi:DUF1353 domain-containing protein [Kribbella sp. NPDC023972]|uniref:DUF1353 domain-containing protein n=1 Tax=Kribbella sp. NPDC023972 TaxID=3154795 RepID=UPI0033C63401